MKTFLMSYRIIILILLLDNYKIIKLFNNIVSFKNFKMKIKKNKYKLFR